MSIDWNEYKNFTKKEFDCKHTGRNKMRKDFVDLIQQIRIVYNRPMIVNSGYRHLTHPIERAKAVPGEHTKGAAADFDVHGEDAMDLMVIAHSHGIRRIGLYQSGYDHFMHLGIGDWDLGFTKTIWTPGRKK